MVALEPGAMKGNHRVAGISVCLARWFIWTKISGVGYEKSYYGALCVALLGEYDCKVLLPSLVLKEPCFHGDGGAF